MSGIPKLAIFGEDGALLTEEGHKLKTEFLKDAKPFTQQLNPCVSKAEAVYVRQAEAVWVCVR